MRLSKDIKDKIKKYTDELIFEEKKKQELLNTNIDYGYIQKLLNMCSDNPDLVITIHFKSGDKLVLQTKYKESSYNGAAYDGEPSINEMEIR